MNQPSPPRVPRGRCSQCWLQPAFCICSKLERRTTRTQLVLLRHWREARKPSNTGRIASLALPGLEIFDYGDPAVPFRHADLDSASAHLLLPGSAPEPSSSIEPVRRLIIPDGTWGQSRRMCKRLSLMGLPRVHLPLPRPDVLRLRKPPGPWAMSTLEAIALALQQLESEDLGADLLALHDRFVHASRAQRGLIPH